MKKSIVSIAIVLALFSTAFAARPVSSPERAAISFKKDFRQATEVSWSSTENYVIAKFVMDKETRFAYYDYQGNLIGLVQHILTSSLPENLRMDIKKHHSNYWVTELFQVSREDGAEYYYIQLKNADETIVLTNEGTYGWRRYALPKNVIASL
jgi:hypothetical protein